MDELLLVVTGLLHALDVICQPPQRRVIDALGRQARGDRFEEPPDLDHLQDRIVLHEVEREADSFEQEVRLQTGDVRAVAVAYVEDAYELQGLDGFADRAPSDPELGCELVLGRQARSRRQGPAPNQLLDARYRPVGYRHEPTLSQV